MNNYVVLCSALFTIFSTLAAMELTEDNPVALFITKIVQAHPNNNSYVWHNTIDHTRKGSGTLYDYFELGSSVNVISSIRLPEEKQHDYVDQMLKGISTFDYNDNTILILTGAEETIKEVVQQKERKKATRLANTNKSSLLLFGSFVAACTIMATLTTQRLMRTYIPKLYQ